MPDQLQEQQYSSEIPQPSGDVLAFTAPLKEKFADSVMSWHSFAVLSAQGDPGLYPLNTEAKVANKSAMVGTIKVDTADVLPLFTALRNGQFEVDGRVVVLRSEDASYIKKLLQTSLVYFWGTKLLDTENANALARNNQEEFDALINGDTPEEFGFISSIWSNNVELAQRDLLLIVDEYRRISGEDETSPLPSPESLISDFRRAYFDQKLSQQAQALAPRIIRDYERAYHYQNFGLVQTAVKVVIEELQFTNIEEFLEFIHGEDVTHSENFANLLLFQPWYDNNGSLPTYPDAYGIARLPQGKRLTGDSNERIQKIRRRKPLSRAVLQLAESLDGVKVSLEASNYVRTAMHTYLLDFFPPHLTKLLEHAPDAIPMLGALVAEHANGIRSYSFIRNILGTASELDFVEMIRQYFHERGHEVEVAILMAIEKELGMQRGMVRRMTMPAFTEVGSIANESIGSPEFRNIWRFLTPLNALRFRNEMYYWRKAAELHKSGESMTFQDFEEQMARYSAQVCRILGCKDFPQGRLLDGLDVYSSSTGSFAYAVGGIVGPILAKKWDIANKDDRIRHLRVTSPKSKLRAEITRMAIATSQATNIHDLLNRLGITQEEIDEIIAWYKNYN